MVMMGGRQLELTVSDKFLNKVRDAWLTETAGLRVRYVADCVESDALSR